MRNLPALNEISLDCNIYKVTSARVDKTPRGYQVFKLQLNGTTWVGQLFPFHKHELRYNKLYILYAQHDNSLQSLVGKYVSMDLKKTEYGINIGSIYSVDVLGDFTEELCRTGRKPFWTRMKIYEFLKMRGRDINPDSSITLNPPYEYLNVASKNNISIVYYNEAEGDTLNLANIGLIFENFYKGKDIEICNPDRSSTYELRPTAIVEHRVHYYKHKSGIENTYDLDVLKLGDSLSAEQIHFLSGTAA